MSRGGYARLRPVCQASGVSFYDYAGTGRKDAQDRAPCPVCGKTVKLRKASGDRWPSMIPHHHASAGGEEGGRFHDRQERLSFD